MLKVGELHLYADQPAEAAAVYARAVEVFAGGRRPPQGAAVAKHILHRVEERAPGEATRIGEVLERAVLHAEAAELQRRAM